ncbi:FixH family protein [Oscillochloris sp. ZM17-4]|uniref:FixH family protein n=1 Tax=Oscillochloris sp. ZM17-4 TaxID=2866714 RepID=UPI00351D1582
MILTLLAACSAPSGPPTVRQEQTVDGITIGLEAADAPKVNATQDFTITLADAKGQLIDDASVYIDLLMPAMPMGSNRPVASAAGQGRYNVQTVYTMSGTWEITVVAELDGVEHRATFPREVPEP